MVDRGSLPIAITAQIRQSGRLLMSNPDSCKIISKPDQQFLRKRFFGKFFMSVQCKKPPFTTAMFKDGSKFLEQFLEHSCETISKSDHWFQRRRLLRISSCLHNAKSHHSPEPCLWTDWNFANIFEKGHPRNNHVKLFQILISGFWGEKFWRISLFLLSPCSSKDQNFAIISKLDQNFFMSV